MRFLFLVLTFLLMSFGSFGQDKEQVDSLTQLVQTATHDSTIVSALLSLAGEYYLVTPDIAFTFCEKAQLIAEKANLKKEMAECYGWLAYLVKQKGDISKALEYNFKSMKILKELIWNKSLMEQPERKFSLKPQKMFKNELATIYNNIGRIYEDQGNIEKALEYYFSSLTIREENNEKFKVAQTYNNIAVVYKNQGEIEKALEYHFLSLKIKEDIERNHPDDVRNKKGIAISYDNIGVIYENQDKIEDALNYYLRSLKIREAIRNKVGMAKSYHNIGGVLCELDSLQRGMRYLKQGLKLAKELELKAWIAVSYSSIGSWHLKMAQVEESLENGLGALAVAKEVGHVGYIKRATNLLSKVYKTQGKFKDALVMYELQIQMRDSIKNEENTKTTIRQQMKYDYEKEELIKEQEEKEQLRLATEAQNRRDNLHYSGIFIGMFLLFGVVLMLGFVKVPPKGAEAIIFLSFLILFEFLLVLLDPFVEEYTGGAPIFKLILNAVLAGLIFPLHQFFEARLKKKLFKFEIDSMSGSGISQNSGRALMYICLSFFHTTLHADQAKIDSLKAVYATDIHDTTKINTLLTWGEELYLSHPDSALDLFAKAADLAKKNLAQDLEGIVFSNRDKAFQKELGIAYNNSGFIYVNQGEIEKGLEYHFMSLKIRERIKDKIGMATSYNNIGFIYDKQGEVRKALEFYFLSLEIRKEIEDKKGMASSYNNIAGIYNNQGKVADALEFYFLSLNIRKGINDKWGMAYSYQNIGKVLSEHDSLIEGMKYLDMGLKLRRELGHKAGISTSLTAIGDGKLQLGAISESLENGSEALIYAKEIGHVEAMYKAAHLLSDVYKKQGKFEDALTMYELEIQMRDSILNEENTKVIIRQQMKYEHEKEQIIKEQQEIEQARIQAEVILRRDNLQYSAIFIGILILFGGVLMLGFVKVRPKEVEGIIFISFLILFEFVLVLADPHIEQYTGGAPGYKLLFNAGIAGLMFPLHQFFEGKLKKRIIKVQRKKLKKRMEQYRRDVEGM